MIVHVGSADLIDDAAPPITCENPHGGSPACAPCDADSGCGVGGNLCLGYGGGNACGVACTTDEACGDGYKCQSITDNAELFYLPKQCVRTAGVCPAN